MRRRWLAVLGMLLPLALLQGCWDIRDIDNRMLVAALGISMVDEKGVKIWVRFPLPHSQLGIGSGNKDFLSASERGETATDALDRLRARMPKYLDLSQTRAVFVERRLAEAKGIYGCLDFVVRDRMLPINAIFTLIEGDMEPLFQRPNPSGELSGVYTRLFFERYAGGTPQKNKVALWEVFSRHYNPLQESLVPLLVRDESFQFNLKGNAYFVNDKMVGWLTPEETLIYELVTNRMTPFEIETAGGANVKVETSKAQVRTGWAGGKPDIHIRIRVTMKLMDTSHASPLSSRKIEEEVNKLLEARSVGVFAKTQAKGSDVFGFGNRYRSSLPPGRYREWAALYKQASIALKVESNMRNVGLKLLQE
ncbi:Ger(x)C family spore germination protein [Cohnella hashimotonis]|uniref:Ger(X)C family spore germination protein n=1 Tax=Cohnella hashimotonis TaxID=2826895 RepID=A0ABT6TP48_9BACL|nr:Ger(x)C family spore germination protein [Cohnella hashimotonis]MDI4648634.1 Ger(x)C family spore germination protein [Cohnella hashimotonis]